MTTAPLVDQFDRHVTYLRVSVTDRCDFRCTYCMAEQMTFLPRSEVLSYEELDTVISTFIGRGVKKVRLTGGEPLVRRDIMQFIKQVGRHLPTGALNELTLTTNGSQLGKYADELVSAGVKRINVSLDSLDAEKFAAITRRGRLDQVLDSIATAKAAGLAIKINMVVMKGTNDNDVQRTMEWAHAEGYDLTLIEGMPLGEVSIDRADTYVPLREVYENLGTRYSLTPMTLNTGGPARYWQVAETGGRIGFITPMSHNFCESCNRVRLSATGKLYLCLGQEHSVDLRQAFREGGQAGLNAALDEAMRIKPKGHDFDVTRKAPAVARHMSATGG